MKKIFLIGSFGVLGVLIRYFLLELNLSILIVNIIAVILMAYSIKVPEKYLIYVQTGFLGAFSSLSTVLTFTNSSYIYLIVNVALCYIIYQIFTRRLV